MVKVEYQVDMTNAGTGTNSTSYVDFINEFKEIVQIDNSATKRYVNPKFYFEAVLSAPSGETAYARLFNVTDNAVVNGSEISTTETYKRVRSGELTLPTNNPKEYKIQIRSLTGLIMGITACRIIVVDNVTSGFNKAEEQVEIGRDSERTTSSTPVDLSYQPIYLYETAKRDGTITIYFEGCLYSSAGGKSVEVSLWNKTDNVRVVELATTSNVPTRVRSSAITLINGKEYVVKKRSSSGKTCTVTGAKLIIQQSGTLTKTQLRKKVILRTFQDDTDWKVTNHQIYLDKANLLGGQTFYYEATLNVGTSPYRSISDLYNIDDSVTVNWSEIWTTSTVWVRCISVSISLTDLKQYEGRIRSSLYGVFARIATSWIVIDAVTIVPPIDKSDSETYVLTELGEVYIVPLPIDKLGEEVYTLYEVSGKMEYPSIMPKVVIPVPIAIHSGMEITYRDSEAVSERKARKFIAIPTSRVPNGKNVRPILKAIRPRYGFKVIRNGEVIYKRWKEDDLLVWRGQMSLAYLLSQGNVGSTVGAFMLLISENATMPDMGDDSGDPEANEFNPLIGTPVTGTWTFEPTVKPSGQYPLSGWLYYEGDITADRNATLRKIGIIDTTPIPNKRIVCEDRVIEYAVLLNDVIRVRYWFPLG